MNTRVEIFERVWKPSWNITKNDWKKVILCFLLNQLNISEKETMEGWI